jgi:signal transduction protein with GAF and PtsI domain
MLPELDVRRYLLITYGEACAEQRNAEREGELLRRTAELRGLHRIIAAANSTLDLDTSMRQVVETVVDVGSVDACAIYLYDRDANELVLRGVAGFDQGMIGQIRLSLGDGVVGAAAQQGIPLMIPDMQNDPVRWCRAPIATHMRGMLAVPIVLFSDGRFHLGTPKLQGVVTVRNLRNHGASTKAK